MNFLPFYFDWSHVRWGIAGISLGGHSTLLALRHDDRLEFGISFMGCPDYLELIQGRMMQMNVNEELDKSFCNLVKQMDPVAFPSSFYKKKVLLVHGKKDTLVPCSITERFFHTLKNLSIDVTLFLDETAEHQMTTEMVQVAQKFLQSL